MSIKHTLPFIFLYFAVETPALAAGLPHNEVTRFQESAWDTQFEVEPRLTINNGCQPYAAVDAAGNYNLGLRNSGRPAGDCGDSSKGNTYVRSRCVSHSDGWRYCARMFAWYFPKDRGRVFGGHRHDWEEVIVYTATQGNQFRYLGVAASRHGDYTTSTNPALFDGYHVSIVYQYDGFTHATSIDNQNRGRYYPLISWDRLTNAARNTLNTQDWGDAVNPMKDSNFSDKLNEGRVSGVPVRF